MTNKYLDHLLVLPEDDHNRRLVNGFRLNLGVNDRRIQVLPEAGGWLNVLDSLKDPAQVRGLTSYPKRHLLLMIDFDGQVDARQKEFEARRNALPASARDRVYLLGCRDEPKDLRAVCDMQLEPIGRQLADECPPPPVGGLWQNAQLQHNDSELNRLVTQVRPFLFGNDG